MISNGAMGKNILYLEPVAQWIYRLTLSQKKPCFYVSAAQVFLKTLLEKEKLLVTSNVSMFSTILENLPPFSSKFKIVVCKLFRSGRV